MTTLGHNSDEFASGAGPEALSIYPQKPTHKVFPPHNLGANFAANRCGNLQARRGDRPSDHNRGGCVLCTASVEAGYTRLRVLPLQACGQKVIGPCTRLVEGAIILGKFPSW